MRDKSLRWTILWAKIGTVSIRTKVMGIVAACIIGSAVALVWYTYQDDSARSREQLQQRGIDISNNLATQSRDLILTDNRFALYELLRSVSTTDEDIIYIFVLDTSGEVLVHSFEEGFPLDLLDKNQVREDEPYNVQALRSNDVIIQDVAVPVLGGKAGVIRLGMSEASISTEVNKHISVISAWVLMVIMLALSVAYAWTSFLTKPISQLAEAVRAIGRGDFRWIAPVWAKDEIGSLGSSFNEMSQELILKDQMREQLLSRLINAQEDERKRISRELHDETSQSLTSLKVGLRLVEESTDTTQIRKKLTELRALAAQTLENVHQLAVDLRPSLLDDLGLIAAIQRYTEEYATKMNINVDSHINDFREQRLAPEIELTVYRIFQEVLTNIAKHAEAKNISVVLTYHDSSLAVIIEDDGKGFDVNAVRSSTDGKGLGLFGMYERASLVRGDLTIESQPGAGTTVFLDVPWEL